jgi:SlyX protein
VTGAGDESKVERRLVELETKIAFQEETIQQLNEVVCDQQLRLERACARLEELAGRVAEQPPAGAPADAERPPHY